MDGHHQHEIDGHADALLVRAAFIARQTSAPRVPAHRLDEYVRRLMADVSNLLDLIGIAA